jgi:hypothetical protein
MGAAEEDGVALADGLDDAVGATVGVLAAVGTDTGMVVAGTVGSGVETVVLVVLELLEDVVDAVVGVAVVGRMVVAGALVVVGALVVLVVGEPAPPEKALETADVRSPIVLGSQLLGPVVQPVRRFAISDA